MRLGGSVLGYGHLHLHVVHVLTLVLGIVGSLLSIHVGLRIVLLDDPGGSGCAGVVALTGGCGGVVARVLSLVTCQIVAVGRHCQVAGLYAGGFYCQFLIGIGQFRGSQLQLGELCWVDGEVGISLAGIILAGALKGDCYLWCIRRLCVSRHIHVVDISHSVFRRIDCCLGVELHCY